MSKMDTDTKISYKEKMEEEYKILCSICGKYKYRVEYKFDQFFIYTKYEVWCYEIKSGKRILLHGNLLYGKRYKRIRAMASSKNVWMQIRG